MIKSEKVEYTEKYFKCLQGQNTPLNPYQHTSNTHKTYQTLSTPNKHTLDGTTWSASYKNVTKSNGPHTLEISPISSSVNRLSSSLPLLLSSQFGSSICELGDAGTGAGRAGNRDSVSSALGPISFNSLA